MWRTRVPVVVKDLATAQRPPWAAAPNPGVQQWGRFSFQTLFFRRGQTGQLKDNWDNSRTMGQLTANTPARPRPLK